MGPGNRPLDIEWLEDFLALAEAGSFSRAAENRAIAQPAFSRHIRALEEWMGVDLFDRSAHPAALTVAGRRFLPLLQDVLSALEAARIKTRLAHDQAAASLRIAATHALSLGFFPPWLGGLEARLQLGPIQMMAESGQACEDLMQQRRVQFVLCHGHAAVPGRLDEMQLPMLRLGADVLVPVSVPVTTTAAGDTAPRHTLAAGHSGGPVRVLAYGDVSGLGRILRARMHPVVHEAVAPASLSTVFTADHAALLRAMALEGRGLAWLPRSQVADDLAAGILVAAGGAEWQVPVEVRLYRQRSQMSAAAEALWELAMRDAGGTAG
jgi:DNA-binding transcriptional LysR family regulator